MDKKINVVIGASGRIGYPLCLELKNRGEYVRAVCRNTSPQRALLEAVADEIVFCDIQNEAEVELACKNADTVFHLAAIISIESKPDLDFLQRVNIDGTKNVISACKANDVRRLVYVSSVHVLPFNNKTEVLTEPSYYDSERVHGAYAKTKASASNLVLDACKDGLDAVIALPSGVIGPYEYQMSNFGQMIADVASKKLKMTINGEYDFVDARDVCIALAELKSKGESGESYILSGHKATVTQLLSHVAKFANVKRPKIQVPLFLVKMVAPIMEKRSLKKGEKPTFTPYALQVLRDNCNFSHEKASKELGYTPRPLSESLQAQVDFYFNNLMKKE